ncbi:hypothetical protein ACFFRR_010594 [Megaselia abdita]
MPSFCVVEGCPYQDTHSPSINFHRFPIARDLLARWKQFAEKPDDWQPTRLSAICSNHFALTTFRNIKNKYLKSSAIPTIKTPVVEFNADEQTARDLERKRPRLEMTPRKPVFIHSSDLFPEHKVQKKIKIPTEYRNEFPIGGYGSKRIKIPKEYEDDEAEEIAEPFEQQKITNDELFYAQFLQSNDSEEEEVSRESPVLVYHDQEYENMEVLAEEGTTEVPEEFFEEVQMQEIESYCRLCGQICEDLEPFTENELIQQMIGKCFPVLTIRPGDGLSSEICSTCLRMVQTFSQFSDEVLSIQKQLAEKFLIGDDGLKEEDQEHEQEQVFALADGSTDHFQDTIDDYNHTNKSPVGSPQQSSNSHFDKVVVQSLGGQKLYKIHVEQTYSESNAILSEHDTDQFTIPKLKTIKFIEIAQQDEHLEEKQSINNTVKSEEDQADYEALNSFEEHLLEEIQQINEPQSNLYTTSINSNVKSEKIIADHIEEVERINSIEESRHFRRILPKPPVQTFPETKPMVKISLNKPSLNEPLVVEPIPARHYYYRPRAPPSMVVNSLYPSPFPVRKDCCHPCKIIFNHTLDFLLHKYKKHPKKTRIPRSKYVSCSKCLRTLRSTKALMNHRFACVTPVHNYFECSGCSQGFTDYRKLKAHQKICFVPLMVNYNRDLEKRTFACDMCDKKFSRKGGLTQHKNSYHFNIKPFVCRVCGHKYALKGDLARCRHKRALLNGFVQN